VKSHIAKHAELTARFNALERRYFATGKKDAELHKQVCRAERAMDEYYRSHPYDMRGQIGWRT
jgi:hypothetical protein